MKAVIIGGLPLLAARPAAAQTAVFKRVIIDSTVQFNSHKPKVIGKFSGDPYNDLGSLDNNGFKLYRYSEGWKPYVIFKPGNAQGFEDAQVADINNDGWNDIIIGGWSNKTIWAENPMAQGANPYRTPWILHVIDASRFSHEVCVADLNNDGMPDVITTSGVYIQNGPKWTFVDIGRSGQGTYAVNVLNHKDGYTDVIALYKSGDKNQIAWFENPGHSGGNPLAGKWLPHIIDANPGGDLCNFEMATMAFTAGDINGDGRVDLVCASQGEGPGNGDDNRQIGDGLVWYEAPKDPRSGKWIKHVVDAKVGWVHASSIKLADFNGDGYLDISYAQQDQSKDRKDGSNTKQHLGIFYNGNGKGTSWRRQLLSQYPDYGAGGFNSKVGTIGNDKLPGIFTSLHGYFHDANPLILWRQK
ncbi:VCBS repeat-containing protein [Mucilaginibacter sp. UR6-11]|uniref:FG-GAP repeat domain-containing protein n=1 Tax=Mucilaginibacter sp. UR6-11 TaxID=1435644 RepID=UPI001E2D5A59|nr:VCBS repeat-containing protein [Mucilaginibacter sp. UR6-11]MCC8424532.1 VCBS repeat-containing protein [Mucilaginibacter sp. UR6-11]